MTDLSLRGRLGVMDRRRLELVAPEAAVALLGALLVRETPDGVRAVARVVETEAYREDDPASHSFAGRTKRTWPMFEQAGTAYVYRSYGVHWCLNVTVEETGAGAAVLLRAAVALDGLAWIRARRPGSTRDRDLLRGPGRLAAGLDIDAPRHDGIDLLAGAADLRLADDGWRPAPDAVVAGPRVGIRHAADRAWRFHLAEVPEVSPYRRHAGALRPAMPPRRRS